MMSELKTPEGIYFDLMYLIGTEEVFIDIPEVPERLFTNYLKLVGTYSKVKEKILKGLEGESKEKFQNKVWPDVKAKIKSFKRQLREFDTEEGVLSNYYHYEDEYIEYAYQHYCYRTGHIYEKPVSPKILSDQDVNKMEKMMIAVGRSAVERSILEEVKDYLEFNNFYSSGEMYEFDKVADAYWQFYNDNESITQDEILFKIEHKCNFKSYAHLPTKEAKEKALEATKQWFRDVKKSSGIIIQK